jgi:hypothetical protein
MNASLHTRNSFLDMLETYVLPQLKNNLILQLDGEPIHFAHIFRNCSNFPGRWIETGGPVAWPPQSPDLSPLCFLGKGYVGDQVYRQRMSTVDEIKARITAAIANVKKGHVTARLARDGL